MTGLEYWCIDILRLREILHWRALLVLRGTLGILLPPIAFEITRPCAIMSLTTSALKIGLRRGTGICSSYWRRELKPSSTTASRSSASAIANSCALATRMTTATGITGSRNSKALGLLLVSGHRLSIRACCSALTWRRRSSCSSGDWKLEAGCSPLLLRKLGSLLRFVQGKRVSPLVVTLLSTTPASSGPAVLAVLIASLLIIIAKG